MLVLHFNSEFILENSSGLICFVWKHSSMYLALIKTPFVFLKIVNFVFQLIILFELINALSCFVLGLSELTTLKSPEQNQAITKLCYRIFIMFYILGHRWAFK